LAMRNQLLIDMPLHTWLRRSEMLICTFENFKSPTNQFEIKGKWWFVNWVCFTEKIKTQVLDYEKELIEFTKNKPFKINLIFCWLNNSSRWKKLEPQSVDRIYRHYSIQLMNEGKLNRRITPHMWRHNFATKCAMNGVSQQATQRLMRHRNPATTDRYYHLNNTWLKSEFDKIWDSL
jgi:site-specific recombinase XerD